MEKEGPSRAPMASKLRTAGGYFFIGLGVIGLMLPVVPQVPFFLAGAALLGKDHRLVRGARNWLKKKGLPLGGDDPIPPASSPDEHGATSQEKRI